MVDSQEMVSYDLGQTNNKVKVKSFRHKMNTWEMDGLPHKELHG